MKWWMVSLRLSNGCTVFGYYVATDESDAANQFKAVTGLRGSPEAVSL